MKMLQCQILTSNPNLNKAPIYFLHQSIVLLYLPSYSDMMPTVHTNHTRLATGALVHTTLAHARAHTHVRVPVLTLGKNQKIVFSSYIVFFCITCAFTSLYNIFIAIIQDVRRNLLYMPFSFVSCFI